MKSLDDFQKNFWKFIEKASLRTFISILQKYIAQDLRRLEQILLDNKLTIFRFFTEQLSKASLEDIGEFLYIICNISRDLCTQFSNLPSNFLQKILSLISQSDLDELGAFLSGATLAGLKGVIIEESIARIKGIIRNATIIEICDFLAHLGMLDPQASQHILGSIQPEIDASISRFLKEGVPLDILITLIGYISKIDKNMTKSLLEQHAEEIRYNFIHKLNKMSLDEITSFFLILAQIDKKFAQSIINETIKPLKEIYKDEITTLLAFIERIQET